MHVAYMHAYVRPLENRQLLSDVVMKQT